MIVLIYSNPNMGKSTKHDQRKFGDFPQAYERASVEKEKDDEIVRLQAELARLGGTSAPSPRGMSSSAAPSVNTPHPSEPSPEPSRSSHQEAEDLVRSLIGGTLRSLDLGENWYLVI